MRAITLFRALAWFGVAVVFWSLNLRWGSSVDVGAGPPAAWHRSVVGAGLLAVLAALALSVSGRKGNPPSWAFRGVAGACAAGILLIAWRIYAQADDVLADAIKGPGWTWLLAGGAMVLGAVIGTLGLKRSPEKSQKKRRRSR